MAGVKSRSIVIASGAGLVGLFMLYAFWPRATQVDIGVVERGPMMTTIDEEAKTRVHDAYVVTAPISGRLLRVDADVGDDVKAGETVVARMLPSAPALLDVRTEEQARAAIEAANAALTLARAEARRARADADYARAEVERQRTLREKEVVAQAALDRAERAWRAASAAVETADAAVAMRKADLERARLALSPYDDARNGAPKPQPDNAEAIPIHAPTSGKILRLLQQSESFIAAGTPILEIGDPAGDLEIVADLLTTDAVKISPGDRVIVDKWGGDKSLDGVVERIEPWGFTKISALGVEEQRANVIIRFDCPPSERRTLGDGYRVEVRIVTWEKPDALKIASSAIFRTDNGWAAFEVVNGRARIKTLDIGRNNGIEAEVLGGLDEGAKIILYPGNQIADGERVRQRKLG